MRDVIQKDKTYNTNNGQKWKSAGEISGILRRNKGAGYVFLRRPLFYLLFML